MEHWNPNASLGLTSGTENHNHLEQKQRKCRSTERRPTGQSYAVNGAERSCFEWKASNQPPVYHHTRSIDFTKHWKPQVSCHRISWQKSTDSRRHCLPLCPKDDKRNVTVIASGTSPHEHTLAESHYCKHTIYREQQRNCLDTGNKIATSYWHTIRTTPASRLHDRGALCFD